MHDGHFTYYSVHTHLCVLGHLLPYRTMLVTVVTTSSLSSELAPNHKSSYFLNKPWLLSMQESTNLNHKRVGKCLFSKWPTECLLTTRLKTFWFMQQHTVPAEHNAEPLCNMTVPITCPSVVWADNDTFTNVEWLWTACDSFDIHTLMWTCCSCILCGFHCWWH